ncbi:cytochrome c biogenesis protein ResB [Geotalea toluenoxydans]|uniref:cytochrome c biogenesis protein ResB n=1 Tax=Geotalea toluenoxydans TaxID=421624 RepID=UPI000B2580D6|nr:cytochrome c biogenesis protein ResB [Geotalea toluenoxydans]
MTKFKKLPEADTEEAEHFPLEPRYHPIHKIPRIAYDFLASAKLAMALLVAILICSLTGVTILRGQRAWELIFSTVWFNGILVLLVINVACCFFGRIWHRRITIISFGMILFHVSFVSILAGIVYNSLFYFRGNIRLTEGEVLPSGDVNSYDKYEHGRFFSFSRLKGETSLIKMHRGFRIEKEDKRAAYEIEVGEAGRKSRGIIYITHNLTHKGFTYYTDREGYSLLVVLNDSNGKEIYGAHLPLQSLKQRNDTYLYATGTKEGPAPFAFPQAPLQPLMELQLFFSPSQLYERGGDVSYLVSPLTKDNKGMADAVVEEGKVAIGKPFTAFNYRLIPKDVRYWVA